MAKKLNNLTLTIITRINVTYCRKQQELQSSKVIPSKKINNGGRIRDLSSNTACVGKEPREHCRKRLIAVLIQIVFSQLQLHIYLSKDKGCFEAQKAKHELVPATRISSLVSGKAHYGGFYST